MKLSWFLPYLLNSNFRIFSLTNLVSRFLQPIHLFYSLLTAITPNLYFFIRFLHLIDLILSRLHLITFATQRLSISNFQILQNFELICLFANHNYLFNLSKFPFLSCVLLSHQITSCFLNFNFQFFSNNFHWFFINFQAF